MGTGVTCRVTIGGARRDRTADLYNAIVALSQLSYGPTRWQPQSLAALLGQGQALIRPPTRMRRLEGDAGSRPACRPHISQKHPVIDDRHNRIRDMPATSSIVNLRQPKSIGHDRDRAQAHRQRRYHRAQQQSEDRVQHAGRDGHSDGVIEKRERQVLFHVCDS